MEKMREEFEAWCAECGYTIRPAETNCGVRIEGDYGHNKVQIAWEAWQASRAALCVKLPGSWYQDREGYILNREDDVKSCLEDAGVRYE